MKRRKLFSRGNIRIGKILGITIEINYTWFVIFFLLTFNLTLFFKTHFELPFPTSLAQAIVAAFLFFASLLLHELAHSYVAKLNKIPIKKITLFIFGGVAQMSEEPKKASSELLMALAGPATTLLISSFFFALYLLVKVFSLTPLIEAPISWLFQINLFLFVFNILPGFPLDGGRVVRAALWYFGGNLERATRLASRGGQALAYLLILAGFYFVFRSDIYGFYGFWPILIGLFLNQAARSSYQQLLFQESLSGVKVKDIMSKEVLTVEPGTTLENLVNDYFLKYKFGRFPVLEKDKLLGVITLHDVKEIPRERWYEVTAQEVVKPLTKSEVISPDEEAVKALIKMAREEASHLLVVEDEGLVGLVTRSDIIRLIKVKTELGLSK